MTSPSITAIVSTYNEEHNIKDCLNSLKLLTDRLVVVDSGSTDKTVEIAKELGAQIVPFHPTHIVEEIRQFSIDQVKDGWILILDADERITQELAEEIKTSLFHPVDRGDDSITHYKIPRKNIFASVRWLRHGGWYPDYQIRLFNKSSFISWPQHIHSTPTFHGECGTLTNAIEHHIHNDMQNMVQKTINFENREAQLLYDAGRTVNTFTFFRKFCGELWRRLILHRGFLDGHVGIIESIYQAYSKTITYLYLYEKKSSAL